MIESPLFSEHKKTAFNGRFLVRVTFTGDGISRVAEVESCTLSSTQYRDYREDIGPMSTELHAEVLLQQSPLSLSWHVLDVGFDLIPGKCLRQL